MWILLLLGCEGERFSGHLRSSTGTALAAVPVTVGLQEGQTDSNGAFSLEPGGMASFGFHGVRWTASAAVGEHDLRLPLVRKVEVSCPTDGTCKLRMTWPEVGGLRPIVERECSPGGVFELQAPFPPPEAACELRSLTVDDRQDTIRLWPAGRDLGITVVSADGTPLPGDCATWVDGVRARPLEAGGWQGQARGAAWVGGQCGDRAMTPVLASADTNQVALAWSAGGPNWDASGLAPWATELQVSDPDGLSVLVRPIQGVFHLPTLAPGDWRVTVVGADPVWGSVMSLPQPELPGLTLTQGGERVLLGIWRVPDPAVPGPIEARLQ